MLSPLYIGCYLWPESMYISPPEEERKKEKERKGKERKRQRKKTPAPVSIIHLIWSEIQLLKNFSYLQKLHGTAGQGGVAGDIDQQIERCPVYIQFPLAGIHRWLLLAEHKSWSRQTWINLAVQKNTWTKRRRIWPELDCLFNKGEIKLEAWSCSPWWFYGYCTALLSWPVV